MEVGLDQTSWRPQTKPLVEEFYVRYTRKRPPSRKNQLSVFDVWGSFLNGHSRASVGRARTRELLVEDAAVNARAGCFVGHFCIPSSVVDLALRLLLQATPATPQSSMPSRIKRRTTAAARRVLAAENEAELEKIPRPFELVGKMPLSTNAPDYSALAHPLSVKDSAVLYTSLARSRKTWLDAAIFPLYWTKVLKGALDEDGKEIQNSNAREKMNKLCEAMLELGPHTFEIRLFLVKDERSSKKEKIEHHADYNYPQQPVVYSPGVKIYPPPLAPTAEPSHQKAKPFSKAPEKVFSVSPEVKIELNGNPPMAPQPMVGGPPPSEGMTPQPMVVTPQPMVVTPQPMVGGPPPSEGVTPQPMVVTPQPMVVTPQPMAVTPQPMAVTPQPTVVTSSPSEVVSPQPMVVVPSPSEGGSSLYPKTMAPHLVIPPPVGFVVPPPKPLVAVPPVKPAATMSKPAATASTVATVEASATLTTAAPLVGASPPLPVLASPFAVVSPPMAPNDDTAVTTPSTGMAPSSQPQLTSELTPNPNPPLNGAPSMATPAPPMAVPTPLLEATPPTEVAPAAPPRPDIMQTPENTMMINNLNMIARVDPPLNALMKIVASGAASTDQILEFQGYIQRARDMGYGGLSNYKPPANSVYRPLPTKGKAPKLLEPRDVRLKPVKVRPPRIPKELRLTAFQEKYLHGANLVFEYVENGNVRYKFPKEAIYELTVGALSEPITDPYSELPNMEGVDTSDGVILVSFLVIHNRLEVEEYERQKVLREERIKQREAEKERLRVEEEARVKAEEEAKAKAEAEATVKQEAEAKIRAENGEPEPAKEEAVVVDAPPVKKAPVKKAKGRKGTRKRTRGGAADDAEDDEDFEPELTEPEIRYTTMTIKLSGIPYRFIPIVVNSFLPQPDVLKRMEYILEHGTRMPKFQLWYQLDGKRDKQLAEALRVGLHETEKSAGSGKRAKYKKRVMPES